VSSGNANPLRFMASEESSIGIYEFLARWFPATGTLLDVGCGSGGFLSFASASGLAATGVDLDGGNVAACAARSLEAVQEDAVSFLTRQAHGFDVVSMIHFVEHFYPSDAANLFEAAVASLAPGGRLLIVTPNYADPTVSGNIFWLDPTHVRPYPPALLRDLCASSGLVTLHVSNQVLVNLGRRRALVRPWQRLRFGREYERPNTVVVAELPR